MEREVPLVESLVYYGWPYMLSHFNPLAISLLREEPFYAELKAQPRVRGVLEPVRLNLASERAEAIALGFE